MKYLLLLMLVIVNYHSFGQIVDSFPKDGTWYYTEDVRIKPVRMFYPQSSLRLCPYCHTMQTPAHITMVAAQYKQADSLSKANHIPFYFVRFDSIALSYKNKHQ